MVHYGINIYIAIYLYVSSLRKNTPMLPKILLTLPHILRVLDNYFLYFLFLGNCLGIFWVQAGDVYLNNTIYIYIYRDIMYGTPNPLIDMVPHLYKDQYFSCLFGHSLAQKGHIYLLVGYCSDVRRMCSTSSGSSAGSSPKSL